MHALLQVPRQEFPFRLFTMLSGPTIAPDLSGSLNTQCDLDEWSMGFLNFFNGVLGNAESMAALRLIAIVAHTDVVQTEQRHAAFGRRLKVLGQRTSLRPAMWLRTSPSGPSIPQVEVPPST